MADEVGEPTKSDCPDCGRQGLTLTPLGALPLHIRPAPKSGWCQLRQEPVKTAKLRGRR